MVPQNQEYAHAQFFRRSATSKLMMILSAQVGISAMGVLRPDLMMKCIIPVVMAGIIAVSLAQNPPGTGAELTLLSSP